MADTDSSCPIRFSTTVPTQALNMINGKFMNDSAVDLANRIKQESKTENINDLIKCGIKIVLSKDANENELLISENLINKFVSNGATKEQAINYFALYLLNLNEFVYID